MEVTKIKPTQTIAGKTEQQMAPVGLLGETRATTIGNAGIEFSNALAEAGQRVENRQSKIAERRTFRDFYSSATTDTDNFVKQNEDLTNPDLIPQYQQLMQDKMLQTLGNFNGNADSRAALQLRLEEQVTSLGANFRTRHNTALRAATDAEWDAEISPIAQSVALGQRSLNDAAVLVNGLMDNYGDEYPSDEMIAKVDAANDMMTLSALNYHVDGGREDLALKLINNPANQSLIASLPQEELGNVLRKINIIEGEKVRAVAERKAGQIERLREVGAPSLADVEGPDKIYVLTGKYPQGQTIDPRIQMVTAIRTAEEEGDQETASLLRQVANIGPKQDSSIPEERLIAQDEAFAVAGVSIDDDRRKNFVSSQMAKDPQYLRKQGLRMELPQASKALTAVNKEIDRTTGFVDQAIMALAGVEPKSTNALHIAEAMRIATTKLMSNEYSTSGGLAGQTWAKLSGGSFGAKLNEFLVPIQANQLLATIKELKAQSKTGSAGGTISDMESKVYMSKAGTLTADSPAALAFTLLLMKKDLPELKAANKKDFDQAYSLITGGGDRLPSPRPGIETGPRVEATTSNDGRLVIGLNGYSTPDQPPSTAPAQPSQATTQQQPNEITPDDMAEAFQMQQELGLSAIGEGSITLPSGKEVSNQDLMYYMAQNNLFEDAGQP
jgi:hypothetical protein